jgi:hypothetical protein
MKLKYLWREINSDSWLVDDIIQYADNASRIIQMFELPQIEQQWPKERNQNKNLQISSEAPVDIRLWNTERENEQINETRKSKYYEILLKSLRD